MPPTISTLFLDNVLEPHNFNPALAPFDLLVSDLFLKLETTNSENKAPYNTVSAKKTSIIDEFVATWRTHFGSNIYPAVRLIFCNRDGRKYHIKDVALTRLVVKLLGLKPGLNDHQIIKSWKSTYTLKVQLAALGERRELGDLPLIIARIMLRRRDQLNIAKSTVTVDDVNATLDKLTSLTQSDDQIALLLPFLDRLTITEVRFFFQMILKQLMLLFFERAFFMAWHPDAYDLFKVCDDIKRIFWALQDPHVRLQPHQLCVQPMYQFVPQSSKKLEISYQDLCKRMAAEFLPGQDPKLAALYEKLGVRGKFLIEEKIDGDRMLMHMVDGQFRWHTRRRRDYTMVYGENVHIGLLTKHLTDAFSSQVKSIVLDGEMVAWSKDRNMLLPFGTLRSAAVQEALRQFDVVDVYEGNNLWPFFLIFDILHLNGHDVLSMPLFYRKNLLTQVVKDVPHRFEILQWAMAQTPDDIKYNMRQIVSEQNEGIMVKLLLSRYRVYSRDLTWIKVKPEYLEQFGENLDLVVIGKIGRVKTSYLCGLRDDAAGGTYRLFCNVANGFLAAVYRQIELRLAHHWRDYQVTKPPQDLMVYGTIKPEHWIDPANSIVLEIKARSIDSAATTTYAAGLTLHNLWCRAVRDDKLVDECLLLQDYMEIKARASEDIMKVQTVNRLRKRKAEFSFYGTGDSETAIHTTPALPIGSIFAGTSFVVATGIAVRGGTCYTRRELQRLITRHGGRLVASPQPVSAPVVVLAQHVTPRLRLWSRAGFDVLSPLYIVACINAGRLLRLEWPFVVYTANADLKGQVEDPASLGDSHIDWAIGARGFLRHLWSLNVPKCLTDCSRDRCRVVLGRAPLFAKLSALFVAGNNARAQAELARLSRRFRRFGGTQTTEIAGASFIVVTLGAGNEPRDHVSMLMTKFAATYWDESVTVPRVVQGEFVDALIGAGDVANPQDFIYTTT